MKKTCECVFPPPPKRIQPLSCPKFQGEKKVREERDAISQPAKFYPSRSESAYTARLSREHWRDNGYPKQGRRTTSCSFFFFARIDLRGAFNAKLLPISHFCVRPFSWNMKSKLFTAKTFRRRKRKTLGSHIFTAWFYALPWMHWEYNERTNTRFYDWNKLTPFVLFVLAGPSIERWRPCRKSTRFYGWGINV